MDDAVDVCIRILFPSTITYVIYVRWVRRRFSFAFFFSLSTPGPSPSPVRLAIPSAVFLFLAYLLRIDAIAFLDDFSESKIRLLNLTSRFRGISLYRKSGVKGHTYLEKTFFSIFCILFTLSITLL